MKRSFSSLLKYFAQKPSNFGSLKSLSHDVFPSIITAVSIANSNSCPLSIFFNFFKLFIEIRNKIGYSAIAEYHQNPHLEHHDYQKRC